MQEFYKNTLASRLIQNILYNTPLPIFKTVKNGDYVYKDKFYIYNTYLIKCTKTGALSNSNAKILDYYTFTENYPKITDSFIPKNNYYDTETHERLGKYLRCIRDIYDINLMPFYNLFSENYCEFLNIKTVQDSEGISYAVEEITKNTSYKLIKIPINYNQKYTIAIDCKGKILIGPALLTKESLLLEGIDTDTNDKTALLNQKFNDGTSNIKLYSALYYNEPISYEVKIPDSLDEDTINQLSKYEKNLYLLIQLPLSCESSITVIEGDFTQKYLNITCGINEEIKDETLNKYCFDKISLLRINTEKSFPFSDRLIEFLLLNVITNTDRLDHNIGRIQDQYNFDQIYHTFPNVWDNRIRYTLYKDFIHARGFTKNDISGFIDKDIESFVYSEA